MAENLRREVNNPVFQTPMTMTVYEKGNQLNGTEMEDGKDDVIFVDEENGGRFCVAILSGFLRHGLS